MLNYSNKMAVATTSVFLLLLASGYGPQVAHTRATGYGSYEELSPPTTSTPTIISTPTSTTTELPHLDNPSNSAATTGDIESETELPDDVCYRCYDKIKAAEDLIDIQTKLLEKQKKLIQRKSKAAMAASQRSALTSSTASTSSAADSQRGGRRPVSSNIRNRTLTYAEDEPIVVSTLRVARSTSIVDRIPFSGAGSQHNNNNNKKFGRNKKDPDLKQLKTEQEQQLNLTCRALLSVQDCLGELSRTCIGDLQFHAQEVWSNQWHSKLNCPYRNNPNIHVFTGLTPKIWVTEEREKLKAPVARPISSPEEVRDRLNQMFPFGGFRPPGVILQPTQNIPQPPPSAANQFNTMEQQQQQQLANRQVDNNNQHQQQAHYLEKGPHMMRKFIGDNNNDKLLSYHRPGNSIRHHQQPDQRIQFDSAGAEDEINLVNVGKMMLVPCCFVLMVAFALLISLYIRQEPIEEVKM